MNLLQLERWPRLRGHHADPWRTIAAWVWTAYFTAVCAFSAYLAS